MRSSELVRLKGIVYGNWNELSELLVNHSCEQWQKSGRLIADAPDFSQFGSLVIEFQADSIPRVEVHEIPGFWNKMYEIRPPYGYKLRDMLWKIDKFAPDTNGWDLQEGQYRFSIAKPSMHEIAEAVSNAGKLQRRVAAKKRS